jgi:F0F1-type ATP synthase assembly protein I
MTSFEKLCHMILQMVAALLLGVFMGWIFFG